MQLTQEKQNTKWIYRKIIQASVAIALVISAISLWQLNVENNQNIFRTSAYTNGMKQNKLITQLLPADMNPELAALVVEHAFQLNWIIEVKLSNKHGQVIMQQILDESATENSQNLRVVNEILDEENQVIGYLNVVYDETFINQLENQIQAQLSSSMRLLLFFVATASFFISRAFFRSPEK